MLIDDEHQRLPCLRRPDRDVRDTAQGVVADGEEPAGDRAAVARDRALKARPDHLPGHDAAVREGARLQHLALHDAAGGEDATTCDRASACAEPERAAESAQDARRQTARRDPDQIVDQRVREVFEGRLAQRNLGGCDRVLPSDAE